MKLFNIIIHILSEDQRHAGHMDILREQLDGKVGRAAPEDPYNDAAFWADRCATIERVAKAAAAKESQ